MTTSLPRPVLIALVGAVAIVALFVATRRGGNEATGPTPAPPPSAQSTGTGGPTTSPGAKRSMPGGTTTSPRAGSAKPSRGGSDKAKRSRAPSARARAASPARPRQRSAGEPRTLPPAVDKALDAHKVVVVLFWNPDGSDDRSVKRAVDALPKHGGKVAVFTDRLEDIARYARITIPTNVQRTPTLVVVDRKGQARVATGYHDSASIEQYVVDALAGA